MAVTLQKIEDKLKGYELVRIAGKNSRDAIVSWVHMVELVEGAEFLFVGEIAITTGVGLSEEHDLIELVRQIKISNAAAVIINVGRYIPKIPDDVIQFCNENTLTLYTLPWKVHLIEIIRTITALLIEDTQSRTNLAGALRNAILFPENEALYINTLSSQSFSKSWNYSAAAIKITGFNSNERSEELLRRIDLFAQRAENPSCAFIHDNNFVFVIGNCDNSSLTKIIHALMYLIDSLLSSGEKYVIGVGESVNPINKINKSYFEATKIMRLQEERKLPENLLFYDDLDIYKILLNMDNTMIMTDFVNKTLGPLTDYDKKHNTELENTLKTYIFSDCSVQRTAEKLFLHKNTINYQIRKINEILNRNTAKQCVRTSLNLAFMAKDIL